MAEPRGEIYELTNSLLWPDFFWVFSLFFLVSFWGDSNSELKLFGLVKEGFIYGAMSTCYNSYGDFSDESLSVFSLKPNNSWLNLGRILYQRIVEFHLKADSHGRAGDGNVVAVVTAEPAGQAASFADRFAWNPFSTSLCPY